MCPLGYHHNGFVATHALGHMMYGSSIYIYIVSWYTIPFVPNFSLLLLTTPGDLLNIRLAISLRKQWW